MHKRWHVALLVLLITLIWGYAWVHMKIGLAYMGPFTFSAWRFGIGTLTLLLVLCFRKKLLPKRTHIPGMAVVGFLQTTCVFSLVMYAMRFVEAGKSSVLLYSMPIWSSLLAVHFLGERLNVRKLTGVLLGSVGLCFIVGWDVFVQRDTSTALGESLIVFAALSWALANIYVKKHFSDVDTLQVSTYQMGFGTIGIILGALVVEWGDPVVFNATSIVAVLFTGVLASAFCFTAWFFVLSAIDTTTATISTMLVPVFGLFFSWLVLDEALNWQMIAGTLLVLAGILVTQIRGRKERSAVKGGAADAADV